MLKIILLQKCCTLSEPPSKRSATVPALCRIPLDRETSSRASIRKTITSTACRRREDNRQFVTRGLIIKSGTLVDATLIAAAAMPPMTGARQRARSRRALHG
jgi:hypothetical protein